jgi:hypothetical protein
MRGSSVMNGELMRKRPMSTATGALALLCIAAAVYLFARGSQGSHAAGSLATATPTKDPSAIPAGYVQLKLALYNRRGLSWRMHLRFAEGDSSYSYIHGGQAYLGLFHDQDLAARAKALAERECQKLSAVLTRTTLAEAELRPDDAGAFMARLVKGKPITEDFTNEDSIAKLSIRCVDPQGTVWKGDREFKSETELDAAYGPLITECSRIGDAAAAFAKAANPN